ncbi:hypothetical protein [Flavobacterium microcysteis]|uniref:Lipoprotein n=1 Tax=Flavobacterium microcysteis TaxID=2596891 RepID=A0A501Q7X5_9FLAO|nr:hypothetical protein [Flavobacterium microcysteis]TPD68257.1 hypothetical protein FJA49_09310 [Flavobacterium microcysteis]
MKQQLEPSLYILICGIFLFLGCQTDQIPIPENKQQNSEQITNVSFSTFKRLTGLADFKTTFKLPENSEDFVALRSSEGNAPDDFIVDTDHITQTVAYGKTAYSFRITPKEGEKEDRRFYLIVYDKKGNWLDMIIESTFSIDAAGNPKETGYKEIYASAGRGTGCGTIFTWVINCNGRGKCADGTCDLCSQCLKTSSERVCGKDEEGHDDGGFTKPIQPGDGGGGAPNPEDEVIVALPILQNPKKECNKVKKLAEDVLFRQKMNNLLQATEYRFEKIFTAYENPDLNSQPPSLFKFIEMNGTISKPQVEYGYFNTLLGTMHSHYNSLLSVYSVDDLVDIYQKLKDPGITDDFFSGLVTKSGTRYLMTIADRTQFIAFGNKHLSTENGKQKLILKYIEKYNISTSNSALENEKGFLKMATELNMGTALFSGNSDFTQWKRLDYANNQVISTTCN